MKIKQLSIVLVGLFTLSVNAQVDYSKIKSDPKYVYYGDQVTNSQAETNPFGSKPVNKTAPSSARDNTNARRKAQKEKESAAKQKQLEQQYNFVTHIAPSNKKFEGYNQLITNNDAYKTTQFDSNYFNSATNPVLLQKSAKYKNLFNNKSQGKFCWDEAANYYKLDPWLLFAVAKVESSFNPHAVNKNKDKAKSADYGLMQINTYWLPTLAKYGITREHLFEPCTSIFIGAWIMRGNIDRLGYNLDGIGAYNSPTNLQIRRAYAKKVYAAYQEVTKDFGYQ